MVRFSKIRSAQIVADDNYDRGATPPGRQPTPRRSQRRGCRAALCEAAAIAVVVAAYTVLAPRLAARIVQHELDQFADGTAGIARFGGVRFLPFTLALELQDLELADRSREISFFASRLVLDFSWRSVFEARPVLDVLSIDAARLHTTSRPAPIAAAPTALAKFVSRARIAEANVAFESVELAEACRLDICAAATVAIDGSAIDFAAARGRWRVVAREVIGTGSRLAVELEATPAVDGMRLSGAARSTPLRSSAVLGWLRPHERPRPLRRHYLRRRSRPRSR